MSILKEVFSDTIPLLEKYAPTLSAILGSLSSASHSVILPILAETFAADPSNLLGVAASIVETPEVQAKLTALEQRLLAHLQKIL